MATNLLPTFSSSEWENEGVTITSSSEYDIIFTADAWTGMVYLIPSSWYGQNVTIGCTSISGGSICIQDSEYNDVVNPIETAGEYPCTIPSSATYFYIVSESGGTVSITGIYAYADGDDSGGEGGNGNTTSMTLRPTSATGTSWQNTARIYDNSTSTAGTVSISSSNYSNRTLTLNFDTSSIPNNATITKATLTVIAKQSSSNSSRRITVRVDINGNSSNRVINQQLSDTNNTTLTADVTNYISDLSSILITGYMTASNTQTFSIYEVYIDTDYTIESEEPDTPEQPSTNGNNLMPPFTTGGWYLDSTCTYVSSTEYDYNFTCTSTWVGVSLAMPANWRGKTLVIGCKDISSNAGFYIQDTTTWAEIAVLTSTLKEVTVTIPEDVSANMCLQAPATAGTVSITGLYAYDPNDTGGGDDEEEGDGQTFLSFKNRLIGYKAVDNEELDNGATVCSTIGQFTSAIASATPGKTIYLRAGTYSSSGGIEIAVQGTSNAYITIKNYPGESPIITQTPISFASTTKYLNFEGIEISDISDLDWGYAINVAGGVSYINLRNLRIINIKCKSFNSSAGETNGCNPIVLYGNSTTSINNVNIENCLIRNCNTGWSEALTLNGNVENCTIKNCTIKDITNIGIDLAGNYEWTGTVGDSNNQTRNCIVENNLIMNCQSPYATSAGLYSDGARDITFRYNVVYNCQCGIELGGEQPGAVSQNFYVYGNLIIDSGRSIGIGGYLDTSAGHANAYIYNNTFVCGNNNKENYGLYVERASNVNFYNNVVYGASLTTLLVNNYNADIHIGNNCWYKNSGSKPSIDTTGIFTDPLFVNNDLSINGDYQVLETSPCVNGGYNSSVNYVGSLDLNGVQRVINTIDIGAFEFEQLVTLVQNLYIGETKIGNIYIGSTAITKIYWGDNLLYSK